MFKRAVLISGILGAISAACALAFVPELARVGRALSTRAPFRGQGFTAVPPSMMERIHRSIWNVSSPLETDSLQGKYCRFPAKGENGHEGSADATIVPTSDSVVSLDLDGQSSVPKSAGSEATCTGSPSSSSAAPRIAVP